MTTLAKQYARKLIDENAGRCFEEDSERQLTDEMDDAILGLVEGMSMKQIFKLIVEHEEIDGNLLGCDRIDDNNPRTMLRNIAEICIHDAILEVTGYYSRRAERLREYAKKALNSSFKVGGRKVTT